MTGTLPLHVIAAVQIAALSPSATAADCGASGPIVDVHMHVYPDSAPILAARPNPYTGVAEAKRNGAESLQAALREMERCGIVLAFVSGDYETALKRQHQAPGILRIAYAVDVPTPENLADIRRRHAEGRIAMIGEVSSQYEGVRPDDPRMEPLWALAEELDIPVGLHMGPAQRGISNGRAPSYRVSDSNPLLLEPVLVRHPKLRIFVMHAGWPMADEMVAMLYAYPQLYVDVGAIDWVIPRAEFHSYLKRLVDAGYADRIMFGIDHMAWVGEISNAIEAVENAPHLTSEQKKDIFYNNAVRFFRITEPIVRQPAKN